MRAISQKTRSWAENRERTIEHFVELPRDALKHVPISKKTRVSKAAKRRRLEDKKQRSGVKRERTSKVEAED